MPGGARTLPARAASGYGQRRASAAAPVLHCRAAHQNARPWVRRLRTLRRSCSPAPRFAPQVQSIGEFGIGFFSPRLEYSDREAERLEAGQAAAFRFIGVDREDFRIAAAGMGDVIGAAA